MTGGCGLPKTKAASGLRSPRPSRRRPGANGWRAIEPSHFDAGTAYVVFTGYREGDDTPYVYRLSQFGKEWTRLGGNLATNNPAIVLREDPVNRNLLYLGTEFGLFVSLDAGTNWVKFGGLPPARIDDLKIHPREGDLVIATHGRSLYVLDDTRPLRELTPDIQAKDAHLFSVRPVHGRYLLPGWEDALGKGWFKGENPAEGALLTVWVREYTGEKFNVSITNSRGQPVAKFDQNRDPGPDALELGPPRGEGFPGRLHGRRRRPPGAQRRIHGRTQLQGHQSEANLQGHGRRRHRHTRLLPWGMTYLF